MSEFTEKSVKEKNQEDYLIETFLSNKNIKEYPEIGMKDGKLYLYSKDPELKMPSTHFLVNSDEGRRLIKGFIINNNLTEDKQINHIIDESLRLNVHIGDKIKDVRLDPSFMTKAGKIEKPTKQAA